MRLRNKILAVLLSVMVCVSLFSCKTAPTIADLTPSPAATPTPTATPSPTPTPTPAPTPEPDVRDFVPGTNDENGYHSDFFRFGFLVPTGYESSDRSFINEENSVDSSLTDPETIRKALIMQLKTQEILYDFLAGNTDKQCTIQVLVRDFTADEFIFQSEAEFLEYLEPVLLSTEEKDHNENLVRTTVILGGEEHPLYQYDTLLNGIQMKGMIFTIKRGTTFAIIQMTAVAQDEIEYVLKSLYTLP